MAIRQTTLFNGPAADSEDLSDVVLTAAAQYDVLVRNGSSQWVNQKLALASLADAGGEGVIGRTAQSAGPYEHIAPGANYEVLSAQSDGTVAFSTVKTAGIADAQVTLAKIADAAANEKLLGSGAAGSGNPYAEITVGTGLTMTGTTLSADAAPTKVYRIGHTYAISGEIKVPSGDTDFIIPFFYSAVVGQTANIVKARHSINSGTSATVKLQRNGGDITGYTGITVNTTPSDTTQTQALSDNDEIALVVTAVSATPTNMNFTIFIELTQ